MASLGSWKPPPKPAPPHSRARPLCVPGAASPGGPLPGPRQCLPPTSAGGLPWQACPSAPPLSENPEDAHRPALRSGPSPAAHPLTPPGPGASPPGGWPCLPCCGRSKLGTLLLSPEASDGGSPCSMLGPCAQLSAPTEQSPSPNEPPWGSRSATPLEEEGLPLGATGAWKRPLTAPGLRLVISEIGRCCWPQGTGQGLMVTHRPLSAQTSVFRPSSPLATCWGGSLLPRALPCCPRRPWPC